MNYVGYLLVLEIFLFTEMILDEQDSLQDIFWSQGSYPGFGLIPRTLFRIVTDPKDLLQDLFQGISRSQGTSSGYLLIPRSFFRIFSDPKDLFQYLYWSQGSISGYFQISFQIQWWSSGSCLIPRISFRIFSGSGLYKKFY